MGVARGRELRHLDGVLDAVGKALEGADGHRGLGGVGRLAVGLGHARQHHLDVALGAQCPRVHQGLPVAHLRVRVGVSTKGFS